MVGGLYPKGDHRKDMGFYIFYMGINLGAAISALLVGYIGETYGWHYGFGLAGIGMLLGQLVYMYGQKYLVDVGNPPIKSIDSGKPEQNLFLDIFKQKNALISFLIISAIGIALMVTSSWAYGLLIMFIGLSVGVSFVMYNDCNPVEKDRMKVVFLSFLIIIVFWGAFEQAGGLMNVYADQKTDRSTGLGFFPEVPASWFQSVNAIFILVFATVVGFFWSRWRKMGKESSSIFKMAVGTTIMGAGFIFMSFAADEYLEKGKSAMYWLILAYLFHTIGELCASPVALSFITKLSPERYVAFMMGAYFAASGLGNKVAGILSELSAGGEEFTVFTGIAIFCIIFGILVFAIIKPLKRLTHGAEDQTEEAIPINNTTQIEVKGA